MRQILNVLISLITLLQFLSFASSSYIPLQTQNRTIQYDKDTKCTISECGSSFFCSSNSKCNESNFTCECNPGYQSKEDDGIVKCCYQQKNKLTAFLLETFIGFGAGHYYVGKKTLFISKLLIYIVLTITTLIVVLTSCLKRDKYNFNLNFIRSVCILLCGCVFVGWQIIDAVLFMLGGYNDGNGVELYWG